MFRKILVPLDGSTFAEQALGTAAMVAGRTGGASGTIELLFVDTRATRATKPGSVGDATERIYVNGVAEEASRLLGVRTTGEVVEGDPIAAIVERANSIAADLIVMSTHGRTGFRRALVGSVADGVVREAGRPVLLHRPAPGSHWRSTVPLPFQRVLVPLGKTDDAMAILSPVLELCRGLEARPTIVRVIPPVVEAIFSDAGVPVPSVLDETTTNFLVDRAQAALTELATDIELDTRIPVFTSVEVGTDVAETLVAVGRRIGADLIALVTTGRGASRVLAGSLADRFLRDSSLPLLLLHRQPASVATPAGISAAAPGLPWT